MKKKVVKYIKMDNTLLAFFNFFEGRDPNFPAVKTDFPDCFYIRVMPELGPDEAGLEWFWFELKDNQIIMTPSYRNADDLDWFWEGEGLPPHDEEYNISNKTPEQVFEIIKQVKELVRD